jgi:hypothetical protein
MLRYFLLLAFTTSTTCLDGKTKKTKPVLFFFHAENGGQGGQAAHPHADRDSGQQ